MMSNPVNSAVLTRIDICMHGKKMQMSIPVNSGALTLIDMRARAHRGTGGGAPIAELQYCREASADRMRSAELQ